MKQPYVSTLIEQDFSYEEMSRARDNIAALSSADLGPYATKTWVEDNFLSDGDFREFATHEEVYSATSGKQDKLTAGPNIDISGNVISTSACKLLEGNNVSILGLYDPTTKIRNYTISATDTTYAAGSGLYLSGDTFNLEKPIPDYSTGDYGKVLGINSSGAIDWLNQSGGATYTAGQYISIDQNNVITASGLQPELPVPTEASYLIGAANGSMSWKARNQWMYISNLGNHAITQDDLNNGYCDVPISWNVPSTAKVNNFSFCMDLSDMYARRGSDSIIPLDTRVEKIKCSIWNDGENTWYSNDIAHGSDPHGMVFEDILGSELSRVTSYWTLNKEVKRAGMTGPYYISFSGPSFRVVFVQNVDLQVGDNVVMTGRISGINFEFGGW